MGSAVAELLGHVETLTRERAELLARIRAIEADVATLRRAAAIMQPGLAGSRPSRGPGSGKAGRRDVNLTRTMLEVLRDAAGPMTAGEVARTAMERAGQDPAALSRSVLTSRATAALSKYLHRGTVLRLDGADGPQRWTINR